mgnify:CR=1 FL=1
MIKLKEAVIVEGKYDKIRLESVIDAPIIVTDGFGIFKNREKMNYIRKLARSRGIIILTDSDSAGFLIRSHITGCIKDGNIKNVYIPDVFGKEKRKDKPSKEGKLGVEGIDGEVILSALKKAGIGADITNEPTKKITKADLYELGLNGTDGSKQKREAALKKLELPSRMSQNAMLEALNIFYSYDELVELIENI